ncbi:ATP-binding protein [Streptomyces sp. NPDC006733]|uniref:ATP-binding protein n=1 Tax=Streptomyces sp. NPDC006733 TaxID=3155460 RepID=UPI0033C52928
MHQTAQYDGNSGDLGAARQLTAEFLARLAKELFVIVTERFHGDVLLVVSELLTNAVRYAHGPPRVELRGSAQSVVVTVWDSSDALPIMFPPDPARIGGHGLEIVHRLCAQVTAERVAAGKRVQAVLRLS